MNASTFWGLVSWMWCRWAHRGVHRTIEHRDTVIKKCPRCRWQFVEEP